MRIENLYKSFTSVEGVKTTVFDNFCAVFPAGEITCLTGPSGSGKTTLLNIIASLQKPDSGSVIFETAERGRVSYLFQEPRLFPWKTVLDNVKTASHSSKSLQYLEETGLSECLNKYPSELSGGQRQRASLARAFAYESQVILLDEPFQNLDDELKKDLTEVFISMWKKSRRTVIWVTHDSSEISSFSTSFISL